jgi:hypothetical protein
LWEGYGYGWVAGSGSRSEAVYGYGTDANPRVEIFKKGQLLVFPNVFFTVLDFFS